ncbi:MAG: hypothetical protein WA172_14555 [Terriglobales bacterium]
MLLMFAPLLSAQVRSSRHFAPLQRVAPSSALGERIAKSQEPPSLAYLTALSFGRENSSVSRASFYTPPANSYRAPANFDLLLPHALTTVQVAAKGDFGLEQNRILDVSNTRLMFAPAYSADFTANHAEAVSHADDPEYYARHIPLVGGFALRVFQKSKAHPRLTHAFEIIQPQF